MSPRCGSVLVFDFNVDDIPIHGDGANLLPTCSQPAVSVVPTKPGLDLS
jgi:hypothetical protein